jgi:SAM-dependent methyltransferase
MPWSGTFRHGWRRLLPRTTWNSGAAIRDTLASLPAGAKLADFGAGGRRIVPGIYTVDGFFTRDTDLVCDLHDIPLPDGSFDAIFCTGTLEHVRDPERVGREILRLLRPGGVAHLDVPFMQGFHADPNDFQRWTLPGLRLFGQRLGFEDLRSGVCIGAGAAVSWILGEYASVVFGTGVLGKGAKVATRLACLPLVYLDGLLIQRPHASVIASAVYYVGRRPLAAGHA